MGARIYTDIISIGSINIYQVTADPNGVLPAPIGSLAVRNTGSQLVYQNTDGSTTWVQVGSGSVPTAEFKVFGEDELSSEAPSIPPGLSKPMQFTAPEDLTVQKVVFTPTKRTIAAVTTTVNPMSYCVLNTISISGTGPDVGSLLDGAGIPAHLFTLLNLGNQPDLNWRMDAGDILNLTALNINGDDDYAPYNVEIWYTPGQSASNPKRFIGGPASPGASAILSGTTSSVGIIQVDAAPASPGDSIVLRNEIDSWLSSAGIGGTLTGVAGARTPGSDDFDATVGTVSGLRDEILAALSDPANSFAAHWSFASALTDRINITRSAPGSIGNTDLITVTSANISVLGGSPTLGGGTSDPVDTSLASPSVDMTIEHLIAATGPFIPQNVPGLLATVAPEVTDLVVNAASSGIEPVYIPAEVAYVLNRDVEIPVTAGDTLAISARASLSGTLIFCAIGRE